MSDNNIFKAYDIRGIYPSELNEEIAYKIGRAFVTYLKCKNVVVGFDMRSHSKNIFDSLTKGITDQGADVINIGLCSTPMCYFANGTLNAESSIMITASHNPGEYNGLKLCREQAIPISGATGIKEIESLVLSGKFEGSEVKGTISKNDEINNQYLKKIESFANVDKNFKVIADCANSMGALEMDALKGICEIIPIFEELDGSFPNHEANPLKAETLESLQKKVIEENADLGLSFDGDADRVGFVDEMGEIIPMDLAMGLIAEDILSTNKETILYDLRSSKIVKEVVEQNGGRAVECRVGHAFIKEQMRKENAFFAGELAGHYYFKDNFTAESSSLAVIYLLNLMSKENKNISELVKPLRKYYQSGEINNKVGDANKILSMLETNYSEGDISHLDGLKIRFESWWFSVRASNTEPLLRLNLEADNKELMEEKRDELLSIITG